MAFTEEDAIRIKEQLFGQLENFPEEKRGQIKEQINSMTTEQLEKFVEQNKLTHLNGECLFCEIIKNEMKSYKIGENESNIAILEINPLSKGHSLIIPLKHEAGITEETKDLAAEIKEKLEIKFEPKTVTSKETSIMGHPVIEITPIYGGESERKQATEEELKSLQEEIITEGVEEETNEKKEELKEDIPKLPPRIP